MYVDVAAVDTVSDAPRAARMRRLWAERTDQWPGVGDGLLRMCSRVQQATTDPIPMAVS